MRFSSAALGMVLLGGLAYYQGDGSLTTGQEAILTGTVISDSPEVRDIDCENPGNSDQQVVDYCAETDPSEDSVQNL